MGLPDSHATPMFETPMESIWKEWVGGPISQRVEPEPWGRLSGLICIACLKVRNPCARQGLPEQKKNGKTLERDFDGSEWFVVRSYQPIKFKVIDGYWRQKTLVLNGYRMFYFVFLWFLMINGCNLMRVASPRTWTWWGPNHCHKRYFIRTIPLLNSYELIRLNGFFMGSMGSYFWCVEI